jgi:alkylation response protein AidB-like acyl-CoA dehydrogenase
MTALPRPLNARTALDRRRGEGQFLLRETDSSQVFTPEDFTDEQRMIGIAARSFFEREVAPVERRVEQHDYELVRRLIGRAGDAGFIATGVPENAGGFGLGLIATMIEIEQFARNASFTMALANQTGIGVLPLLFYGNSEQKGRYLADIMKGRTVLAFALTESHSGSDALEPRTTAVLDESGEYYRLNGEKMWVTSAAIANLFTVFARVDGKHLAAFLVERDWPGVSFGAEEVKLGVRGSSTRTLMLDDVPVPVRNLLGDVGQGHRVMFGTLNIGRARLGAALVGAAKAALELSARYAASRTAFSKPISEYGLIQEKLAGIASSIYAAESMAYRLAGLLEPQVSQLEKEGPESLPGGIGFVTECSALKVLGSELYQHAADEGLQIHGGNGYSEAYPIERHYRDARVTRIFEGTNEIHRLLMVERLLKLALSGELPLFDSSARIQAEPPPAARRKGTARGAGRLYFAPEAVLAERMKRLSVLLITMAADRFKTALSSEQVLMGALGDLVIETFATDSAVARSAKTVDNLGEYDDWPPRDQIRAAMTSLFVSDSFERAARLVRKATGIITRGAHRPVHALLERLSQCPVVDRGELCGSVSAAVIRAGGYIF